MKNSKNEADWQFSSLITVRAQALCEANGFNRVVSRPRLSDAGDGTELGPWKDDFLFNHSESQSVRILYADVSLRRVRGGMHLIFSELKCGKILQHPMLSSHRGADSESSMLMTVWTSLYLTSGFKYCVGAVCQIFNEGFQQVPADFEHMMADEGRAHVMTPLIIDPTY
jgi:hypothetical protein